MTRSKIEDEIANISYADTDFDRDTNWLDFVIFMYKIELGEGRDMPPQSDEVAFS